MSGTQQALGIRAADRGQINRGARRWHVRLQGSDTTWAIAFLVPYVAIFVAFVVYPVVFGLWMGSRSDAVRFAVLRSDVI